MPEAVTVSEYIATRKESYSLYHLGIPQELRGVSNYQKYGEFIDNFINDEINLNQLEDNIDSYRNILDGIMASIGLDENTKANIKLDKLYRWIKNVVIPQGKIERKKRKILNAQL